jgi:hypothetical protein
MTVQWFDEPCTVQILSFFTKTPSTRTARCEGTAGLLREHKPNLVVRAAGLPALVLPLSSVLSPHRGQSSVEQVVSGRARGPWA